MERRLNSDVFVSDISGQKQIRTIPSREGENERQGRHEPAQG